MNDTPPIGKLLPHAAPMIWLDAIVGWDPDSALCEATVRPKMPFVVDGQLPAAACLEYMAQCVGAWVGLGDYRSGKEPKIGLIIACREIQLLVDTLAVGDRLQVTSQRLWGDAELGNFACEVQRDGALVAKARMSAYRGEVDPAEASNTA